MNSDEMKVVLSFLSLTDDYESFDIELAQTRQTKDPEEWTGYAMKAAAKGELPKVEISARHVPDDQKRWVVYEAAAEDQVAVLEYALREDFEFDVGHALLWTGKKSAREDSPSRNLLKKLDEP